jgi:hypothetical protein
MDQEMVNQAVGQAQKMVDGVKEPHMKAAAFGVLLSKLLETGARTARTARAGRPQSVPGRAKRSGGETAPARVLGLKGEGLFEEQRTLAEIRDELGARGWHYAVTALSGVMQALVQARELRRVRVKVGKRDVWKYSNY